MDDIVHITVSFKANVNKAIDNAFNQCKKFFTQTQTLLNNADFIFFLKMQEYIQ
jgi:hypothetical protein